MKIWKSIIIDDEPLARMELKRLLTDHDFIQIIGESGNVHDAKELIEDLNPDLIFLDIDLGSHSGFDLLEYFDPHFHTIFVTAYDEFAIRAFEVNALDYLLKPVHPERLKESLKRLGSPYKEEIKSQLKPYDKLLINQHSSSRFITVDSISYIEAQGDYSRIYTNKNITGIIHHTIKKWVDRLPPNIFCQAHRSYIVNLNHIEELLKKENNRFDIKLRYCTKVIPVSRSYSKLIRDKFSI